MYFPFPSWIDYLVLSWIFAYYKVLCYLLTPEKYTKIIRVRIDIRYVGVYFLPLTLSLSFSLCLSFAFSLSFLCEYFSMDL